MPPFVAETTFHVRYAETDAMGVVHHSSYVIYLEEGRSHYIRQRGSSYADFERDGYYLAVTELNIRYPKPAVYDQLLKIRCWITNLQSRSITFAYEVVDAHSHELYVTATSKHLCLNRQGQVAKIPDEWRRWIED